MTTETRIAAPPRPRPVIAWRAVLLLAGVVAVVLGVTSAWYGYFGDEYYFLAAGARPSLGYADQPPLLPLLARALDALAPGSLVVLRLPATLLTAGTVVVAAATAAELGGRRRAQLLAAAATAVCPYLLSTGHLLATSTVDPFLWALLLLLVVRWIRREDGAAEEGGAGGGHDRLLLGAGVVVAVALADKVLIPVLLGGLAVGVAIAGPRRMLRRPMLWAGLALAALATVPTALWQAAHGWPQLRMGAVVSGEGGLFGDRWQFLPRAVYYAGLGSGAVLLLVGAWALVRLEALRRWRCVGIAALAVTVVLLAAGGRPYYLSGLSVVWFAAGGVAVEAGVLRSRWRWTVTPAAFAVTAIVTAVYVLPLGPAAWRAPVDFEVMGQVGWGGFTAAVAERYASLPPDERARTAVVTFSYWYASGLEREGRRRGLPATIYSTHRGFGYFDPPPGSATALLVGAPPWARRFCARLVPLPDYRDPAGNGVFARVPMGLCTPSAPWAVAWPSLRNLA